MLKAAGGTGRLDLWKSDLLPFDRISREVGLYLRTAGRRGRNEVCVQFDLLNETAPGEHCNVILSPPTDLDLKIHF